MKVTLVHPEGCQHCVEVKATLNKLKNEFPSIKIEEINMMTDEGQALVQKHGIMASPGILVDDEFFMSGGATEEQLRERLKKAA